MADVKQPAAVSQHQEKKGLDIFDGGVRAMLSYMY